MGVILDKLTGNHLLVEVKETDLSTLAQAKLNQGKVAGIITTTLPSTGIVTDKVYEYAGANGGTVTGGTIKDTNGATITTLQNGDSVWYNISTELWYRIPFQSLANNSTLTEQQKLTASAIAAYRNIFADFKGTSVAGAITNERTGTLNTVSTFNGWRWKCNFLGNFQIAEINISHSAAGSKIYGYIWDEAFNVIATAVAYTQGSINTLTKIYFVFDKEISSNLLTNNKFWVGFKGDNNTTIIMDSNDLNDVSSTSEPLLDLTVKTQYVMHNNPNWMDVYRNADERKSFLRLYNNVTATISAKIAAYMTLGNLDLVPAQLERLTKYNSLSSIIAPSSVVDKPYGSPFTGWGSVFNKTNVSFNALKIPAINRTGAVTSDRYWKYIKVIVKDAYNSGTIIAQSLLIPIDSTQTKISNIIAVLFDSNNNPITLTDASFVGNTYFVGYILYNDYGENKAYGGCTNATQSNYSGNSYYMNDSINHVTGWGSNSGNPCVPFEHLLVVNPSAYVHWKELDAINTNITTLQSSVASLLPQSIEISLPDTIYAIVGDKLQLFFRGIVKAINPYNYNILVTCTKGAQYPRYFEYTPVSGDIGTTTFKIEVKDKDGTILGSKTVNLVTKSAVQSPLTTKKILCVGDSLTSDGTWCKEASRRLIGTGGTPAGLALTNISFDGRKEGGGIGWEGTGGWSWDSYITAGAVAYRFNVSGVVTPPETLGSTYTNNGQTFIVAEVNITGGTGNIRCLATGAPSASGTLTKASGAGDLTISFASQTQDVSNPFWNNGTNQLDVPTYVNTYLGGQLDVVYFLLTLNGQPPNRTDFSAFITSAKTLIDHIHANYASCKIKVMGIQVPSLNGGMGANYGATGTSYADGFGIVKTVLNMNTAYQNFANEAAYSSFVEFVNVSSQFDSENNMPQSDVAVNSRSSVTEKRGTNGVHPDTSGYYQIADVVFRNFVANFCQ